MPISFNVTSPVAACAGKKYVTKSGDTCDSIAQGNLVSSGSLYKTNPKLIDCAKPSSGTELCLPPSCEKRYKIKAGDDCVAVALANGISWQQLDDWNGMVDCSGSSMLGDNPNGALRYAFHLLVALSSTHLQTRQTRELAAEVPRAMATERSW